MRVTFKSAATMLAQCLVFQVQPDKVCDMLTIAVALGSV
jgi:hypothetical protein